MKKAKTLMAVIACAVMLLTVVTSAVGFAAAGDDAAKYAPKAAEFMRQSDGNSYIEWADAASGGVTVTRTGHPAASRDAMSYKALKLDGLHMVLKNIDFSKNGGGNRAIFMFLWNGSSAHDSSNCIGLQIGLTAGKVKFWNKASYDTLDHAFSSFNADSKTLDVKFAVVNGVWQLTINGETLALTDLPITENIAGNGTARVSFTNADVGDGTFKCTFDIASIHGGDQTCYEAPAPSGDTSSEASEDSSAESSEESTGESSEESSETPADEADTDMDAVVHTPAAKDFIFSGAASDTRIGAEDTEYGLKITRKGSKSASGNSAVYTKPLAMDGLHIRLKNIALKNGQTITVFVNPTANTSQWGFNYGLSLDIRLGIGSLAISIPDTVEIYTILDGNADIENARSLDIVLEKDKAGKWQITINGATVSLDDYDLSFLNPEAVYVGFADGDLDGRDAITGSYHVTVLHGGDTECLKGATAEKVVADLVKVIGDLPETDKLTLDNEAAVMSVGDSFKALEKILPQYVDNFDELKATVDAAVAKISALREAADGADDAAVKAVYDMIAAIEVPNADDKAGVAAFEQAINKAKAAFDALRKDLQERVENSGDLDYYALLLDGMKSEEDSDADSDDNSDSSDNKTESGSSKPDADNPDTGVSLPVGVALAAVLAGGALVAIRRRK